ncbi:MAG TPA: putative DNA-binding protein [Pseudogracilibacillus sp.]|nr:putative DNA-binding protein [Pseudogracilibacillus sp.]
MLEKTTRINFLYDYYVSLLTEKQRNYLSLYYHEDYSLGEIAEQTKVSRQAVYDNIKRTENLLEHYEDNLKLYEKNTKRNTLLKEIKQQIKEDVSQEQIFKKLEKIANID